MFAPDIVAIDRIIVNGWIDLSPARSRSSASRSSMPGCESAPPRTRGTVESLRAAGRGDHPAQYCWPSLHAGTWNLSGYTGGAIGVTVTTDGDGSANFGVDNLWLSW